MKWLAIIKQFPKFVLVVGVIVGSTLLFGFWWLRHSAKKAAADRPQAAVEDITPKLRLIESKWDHLILVDNDLYDVDSGQLLFKNWLTEGLPLEVFYDDHAKKIIGRYERGFVRYALDGTTEATLSQKLPPLFSADLRSILYVKDKDIWKADVNWPEMKFENDKKLTSIEQIYEQNFASNVFLRTDKTLVVRNASQFLRVNLETGDVKPMRMRLGDIGKRRSPDSKWVVGVDQNQFHCYDVDADEMKTLPVGRAAFTDCQWLDNDRCVVLHSGKSVLLYDRPKQVLTETITLPAICNKLSDPSPDDRFLFCIGNRAGFLLDLEKKAATSVTGGGGLAWVSNDTFAFYRETPDSGLRGTWLQIVGEAERRISPEPYIYDRAGGKILLARTAGTVILVTKHGISTLTPTENRVVPLISFEGIPSRLLEFSPWSAAQ